MVHRCLFLVNRYLITIQSPDFVYYSGHHSVNEPFSYWTIQLPDTYSPFEYRMCPVTLCLLYLEVIMGVTICYLVAECILVSSDTPQTNGRGKPASQNEPVIGILEISFKFIILTPIQNSAQILESFSTFFTCNLLFLNNRLIVCLRIIDKLLPTL